jgi:uncharacterized protein YdeI (YjbR/CyaY-like superfamily)
VVGVWIKFAKKAATRAKLTKAKAIDAALCHGWIDGKLEKYNDQHWLVRFTPRKSRSKWSALNRNRALTLIKEGRMRPAGFAQIEAAKADGRWEGAYAPASRAEVPIDLQKALDNNPKASAFFATLNSRNRYAILYRIGNVKKAETRARKEAYPVDSGLSRCSMLSDRIGAVARADIDGEGAVARGIPEVVSR